VTFVTSVNLGAVDVGASGIKFAHLSETGELRGEVERLPTPYPCTPERLLDVLATWIRDSGCDFVAVGFPGDMTNGVVDEPGNLSRISGIASPVDAVIHASWEGFALEATLATLVATPVRVVNDATFNIGHGVLPVVLRNQAPGGRQGQVPARDSLRVRDARTAGVLTPSA
jgi:polyphosphate glucokinase